MEQDEKSYPLYSISDDRLQYLLAQPEESKTALIHSLIKEFYPHVVVNSEEYINLQVGYRSSWILEMIYRHNAVLREGFQAVYTKTGLITELVNELYYAEDNYIIH